MCAPAGIDLGVCHLFFGHSRGGPCRQNRPNGRIGPWGKALTRARAAQFPKLRLIEGLQIPPRQGHLSQHPQPGKRLGKVKKAKADGLHSGPASNCNVTLTYFVALWKSFSKI